MGKSLLRWKIVTDEGTFKDLREPWNDLLHQTSSPSIFSTWEWAYTWWLFFKRDRKLFIIAVWDQDNRLVGLAPFFQDCSRVLPGIKLTTLCFLGSKIRTAEYLDFIISPALRKEVMEKIFQALHEQTGWDLLVLTDILEDSPNISALKELAQGEGYRITSKPLERCPYIAINGSWHDYLQSLEKHMGYNLRRYHKNLSNKFGPVAFETLKDFDDIDFYLEKLIEFKEKNWQSAGKNRLNLPPQWRTFHGQIARAFSQQGWTKVYCLKVNQQMAGLWYGFSYGNKYWYLNSGYDVNFPRVLGLGKLLLAETIKAAFEEGVREYDLLRGAEAYKYEWARAERVTKNLTVLRRTTPASIWAWQNAIEVHCRRWLKGFLPASLYGKLRNLKEALQSKYAHN